VGQKSLWIFAPRSKTVKRRELQCFTVKHEQMKSSYLLGFWS